MTGGVSSRLATLDESTLDIRLAPETDGLLRAIQRIKEELRISVELAAPMVERGLVQAARPLGYFEEIEPSSSSSRRSTRGRSGEGSRRGFRADP